MLNQNHIFRYSLDVPGWYFSPVPQDKFSWTYKKNINSFRLKIESLSGIMTNYSFSCCGHVVFSTLKTTGEHKSFFNRLNIIHLS